MVSFRSAALNALNFRTGIGAAKIPACVMNASMLSAELSLGWLDRSMARMGAVPLWKEGREE